MTTKHYATYYYPSIMCSGEGTVELPENTVEAALKQMPTAAFAFTLYDVETQTATLEDGSSFEHDRTVYRSGMIYPCAAAFTVDEVKALTGDHRILVGNMIGNGWQKVVRTRAGNFQPLLPDSVVI